METKFFDKLLVLVQPIFRINCGANHAISQPYLFKSSTDMFSNSICFARSISAASARMQIDMRGQGTLGSLYTANISLDRQRKRKQANFTVPEKRLSCWGSQFLRTICNSMVSTKFRFFTLRVGEQLFYGAPHAMVRLDSGGGKVQVKLGLLSHVTR